MAIYQPVSLQPGSQRIFFQNPDGTDFIRNKSTGSHLPILISSFSLPEDIKLVNRGWGDQLMIDSFSKTGQAIAITNQQPGLIEGYDYGYLSAIQIYSIGQNPKESIDNLLSGVNDLIISRCSFSFSPDAKKVAALANRYSVQENKYLQDQYQVKFELTNVPLKKEIIVCRR